MKIARAGILTALDMSAVGSRVVNVEVFMAALEAAIGGTDFGPSGQKVVELDKTALDAVTCGVGIRTETPEDYLVRSYRGQVGLYLKRELAAKPVRVRCVVYTRSAYLSDPEVRDDVSELARVQIEEPDYVLVAVLADGIEPSERTPERFVAALAGENNEYGFLTNPGGGVGGGTYRAKVDVAWIERVARLRVEARDVIEYGRQWCVVADPEPVYMPKPTAEQV